MTFNKSIKYTEINQEIIGPEDGRRAILNTRNIPYRWICSLEIEFSEPVIYTLGIWEGQAASWDRLPKTRNGCGTGLLIGSNTVLTNAHVLMGLKLLRHPYSRRFHLKTVLAKKVRVIPARQEVRFHQEHPFGIWKQEEVKVHPLYLKIHQKEAETVTKAVSLQAIAYDYGIIRLKRKLSGKQLTYWNASENCTLRPLKKTQLKAMSGRRINVCGFPGDLGDCGEMYLSSGRLNISNRSTNLLFHKADTKAGMSGSPIWIKKADGRRQLLGIHSTFQKFGQRKLLNMGPAMTPEFFAQLSAWNAL